MNCYKIYFCKTENKNVCLLFQEFDHESEVTLDSWVGNVLGVNEEVTVRFPCGARYDVEKKIFTMVKFKWLLKGFHDFFFMFRCTLMWTLLYFNDVILFLQVQI